MLRGSLNTEENEYKFGSVKAKRSLFQRPGTEDRDKLVKFVADYKRRSSGAR